MKKNLFMLIVLSSLFLSCENKREVELVEKIKQFEEYTIKPIDYTNLNEIRQSTGKEIYVQGFIKDISTTENAKLWKNEEGGFFTYILLTKTISDIANTIYDNCNEGCFIRIKTKVFDHRDGLYLIPVEIVDTYSMSIKKQIDKELKMIREE